MMAHKGLPLDRKIMMALIRAVMTKKFLSGFGHSWHHGDAEQIAIIDNLLNGEHAVTLWSSECTGKIIRISNESKYQALRVRN